MLSRYAVTRAHLFCHSQPAIYFVKIRNDSCFYDINFGFTQSYISNHVHPPRLSHWVNRLSCF